METIDRSARETGAASATVDDERVEETAPRRRPARRIGLVAAVAAVVATGAWLAAVAGGEAETAVQTTRNTATVQRTDLVVTETLDGTLGYGDGAAVVARAGQERTTIDGRLSGTVTMMPEEGAPVAQGEVLYAVDHAPVAVMYGDTPAYRPLSTRSGDGPDVEQLEAALVALGFDPDGRIVVDQEFTSATADAVEAFQESIGAEADGTVGLGEVIFAAGPVYVAEAMVAVGDTVGPGTAIIATSSSPTGTITAIVEAGTVAEQGDTLFEVDGAPVSLLYGTVPAYRTMRLGTAGGDVAQLETALSALGFADEGVVVVDGVYDTATREAVLSWQRAIGAPADGVVDLGDVVFTSGSIRIGSLERTIGDMVQDGATIMTTSAAETFVIVQLPAADQGLLSVGDAVVVELPNHTEVEATVATVGTVAQAGPTGGAYFDVTIVLDDPAAGAGLDEAPVEVAVVTDSTSGVLAVPVTALLALAEGGYAVEVVAPDGSVALIGVDPGLFADGFVEVTGNGLDTGMEVVIP